MLVPELHIEHWPSVLSAVFEQRGVPFRMHLVAAVVRHSVVGATVVGREVSVGSDGPAVGIVVTDELDPPQLVNQVLLVIRFLGEIPVHIRVGTVTGDQPAEIQVVLGTALGGPTHHLVIDLDHHVGDHGALI